MICRVSTPAPFSRSHLQPPQWSMGVVSYPSCTHHVLVRNISRSLHQPNSLCCVKLCQQVICTADKQLEICVTSVVAITCLSDQPTWLSAVGTCFTGIWVAEWVAVGSVRLHAMLLVRVHSSQVSGMIISYSILYQSSHYANASHDHGFC